MDITEVNVISNLEEIRDVEECLIALQKIDRSLLEILSLKFPVDLPGFQTNFIR